MTSVDTSPGLVTSSFRQQPGSPRIAGAAWGPRASRTLFLAAALGGCADGAAVSVIADHPAVRDTLVVAFLPYNRDSIVGVIRAQPEVPSGLRAAVFDTLAPRLDAYLEAERAWAAMLDSVRLVAAALDTIPRGDSAYREPFALYRRLERAARGLEAERDRQYAAVRALRTRLDPLTESLARRLERWAAQHDTTYRRLARTAAPRRDALVDTLRPGEALERGLPAGRWWVYARAADPSNPYAEIYWNVPAVIAEGAVTRVRLDSVTAARRIRGQL